MTGVEPAGAPTQPFHTASDRFVCVAQNPCVRVVAEPVPWPLVLVKVQITLSPLLAVTFQLSGMPSPFASAPALPVSQVIPVIVHPRGSVVSLTVYEPTLIVTGPYCPVPFGLPTVVMLGVDAVGPVTVKVNLVCPQRLFFML